MLDGVRAWARIAGFRTGDDSRALEPRHLWLIEAEGHRFGSKEKSMTGALEAGPLTLGQVRGTVFVFDVERAP